MRWWLREELIIIFDKANVIVINIHNILKYWIRSETDSNIFSWSLIFLAPPSACLVCLIFLSAGHSSAFWLSIRGEKVSSSFWLLNHYRYCCCIIKEEPWLSKSHRIWNNWRSVEAYPKQCKFKFSVYDFFSSIAFAKCQAPLSACATLAGPLPRAHCECRPVPWTALDMVQINFVYFTVVF